MVTGENLVQLVAKLLHQGLGMAGLSGFAFVIDPVVCAVVMFGFISVFVMFLVWM